MRKTEFARLVKSRRESGGKVGGKFKARCAFHCVFSASRKKLCKSANSWNTLRLKRLNIERLNCKIRAQDVDSRSNNFIIHDISLWGFVAAVFVEMMVRLMVHGSDSGI